MTPTYNLLDEPWIEARLLDGNGAELSLLGAFERAPEIRTLGGEVPTQYAALVRLMLAILYRACSDEDETPREVWADLWERGGFAKSGVAGYLERFRDRFDLLHPETPFLQVADLRTAKGEFSSLARLIVDVPPGAPFFTTRSAAAIDRLPLAEAARWLVHTHAYDPSGIKSGALGDDRVKGGKGYPIGVAPAGWLGLVVIEGANLFETLLLNLDLRGDAAGDSAVWERPALTASVERRAATRPQGRADLLTWPSRRVRLRVVEGWATGVVLANGDPLHPRDMYPVEHMTPWRRSEAQEKLTGLPMVLMPRGHQLERQIWRGLAGLLGLAPTGDDLRGGESSATLEWLAHLREFDMLPDDLVVRTRAIGLEYGSQSSVVDDLYDDSLQTRMAVLASTPLAQLAVDAVGDADGAVRVLGDLARNLVLAAGGEVGSRRDEALARGYDGLDAHYRRWVSQLSAEDVADDQRRTAARQAWQLAVSRELRALGSVLIGAAGDPAWIGRTVKINNKEQEMNTSLADRYFAAGLARVLPLAMPDHRESA